MSSHIMSCHVLISPSQEYFSNELALAIRDIRAEYEAINEAQRGADTDGWYKAKFNEMSC